MGDILHGRKGIETATFNQRVHEAKVAGLVLASDILAVLQVNLHMTHHLLTTVIPKFG